jgi:hypothetical protein
MFKSKSLMFGVAAAAVVAGLTIASMAVTTTSGAGTDDTDTDPVPANAAPTSVPVTTPPQAPIEAPADAGIAPTGAQAGAGALPDAGYGDTGSGSQNTMLLFGLAGAVLAAGTALMFEHRAFTAAPVRVHLMAARRASKG